MKKYIIMFVCTLLIQQIAKSQGTTFLSNLGQSFSASNPVGNNSWLAGIFDTGNNTAGYLFDSVELGMANATGSPNGFTAMIYANNGNPAGELPGSSLGTLNGSLNPVTGGIYTYTSASSIILLPETEYYIVMAAVTTVANGAYEWNYTSMASYNPIGQWIGAVTLASGNSGLSWSRLGSNPSYDFSEYAINATAIPEPPAEMLLGLGGTLLLGFGRWKAKAA